MATAFCGCDSTDPGCISNSSCQAGLVCVDGVCQDRSQDASVADACTPASEGCDAVDNDCDGVTDEGTQGCDTCESECLPPVYQNICHTRTDVGIDGTIDSTASTLFDGGRAVGVSFDDDNDETVDRTEMWAFDAQGRVSGDIREDSEGNQTGSSTRFYEGDQLVRVELDLEGNDGSVDAIFYYTYVGTRLSAFEVDRSADGSIDELWTYNYDSTGVQTGVTFTFDGAVEQEQTFLRDASGNRTEVLIDQEGDGSDDIRVIYDYSCVNQ